MEPNIERDGLDFSVAKSIRYHAYRRAFWEGWDRATKVFVVVSGTGVFITLLQNNVSLTKTLAIIVAVTSALDLVVGFGKMVRDHDQLYRAFSRLAQDIAIDRNPTESTLADWQRRRLEIEMDEPFIADWLERRCSGEEAVARGREVNPAWKLNPFQFHFAQWNLLARRPGEMKPI